MEKKDLTDLGKQIENAVQDALNSKDFAKLKQEIKNTVDSTIDEVRTGIRSGLEYKNVKYNGIKQSYEDTKKSLSKARPVYKEIKRKDVKLPTTEFKAPVPICKRPAGRVSNVLYSIFGYVGVSVSSFLILSFIITMLVAQGYTAASGILAAIWIPLLSVSTLCTMRGTNIRNRLKRFRLYVRYLQGRAYCSIKELASLAGQSPQFIAKDLRKMIALGMFPEGHMDDQHTSFMLTNETYRHYLSAQESLKRRQLENKRLKKEKLTIEKKQEPREKNPVNNEFQSAIEEGRDYLLKIREANNVIVGKDISTKLDRLETIVSKIFNYVEKKPQKLPEIRKFMSYYLPTTLKLVNAYREFDEQIVQGDNIKKAKVEIKDTLDTINTAFENLLDSLYQEDVMDISTDITVLETMLAQEGLTDNSITKQQ